MKNIILLLILVVAGVQTALSQKIKGTGPRVTRTLDLASFEKIESNISADVEITQGSTQKITVEGQANIIDLIQTEVSDNKWKIKFPKNTWGDYEDLKIKITLPKLTAVGLGGSGSIITTNMFTADEFNVGVSGSGTVKVMVEANRVDCGLSGSGNIHLQGKTHDLKIGTSGSGNVKALDFSASQVKIGISGSGSCEVSATDMLEAGISGSGSIRYKGQPKIKTGISGSGSIQSI